MPITFSPVSMAAQSYKRNQQCKVPDVNRRERIPFNFGGQIAIMLTIFYFPCLSYGWLMVLNCDPQLKLRPQYCDFGNLRNGIKIAIAATLSTFFCIFGKRNHNCNCNRFVTTESNGDQYWEKIVLHTSNAISH